MFSQPEYASYEIHNCNGCQSALDCANDCPKLTVGISCVSFSMESSIIPTFKRKTRFGAPAGTVLSRVVMTGGSVFFGVKIDRVNVGVALD